MKRNSLWTASLLASMIGGLVFVNVVFLTIVQASTTVNSMIITTDTRWTKADSPFTLTGPVAVANGVSLLIEPGVTVNLGNYYLQVNGTLRAQGTIADRITFSSTATEDLFQIAFTQESTSWNEQTGSGCIIENAIVNASISVNGVSPKISNNYITDNTAGMMNTNVGIYIESGSPVITNNHIIGGISIDGEGSSLISNNVITGGMGIYKGSHVISNNEISGGSSYFWIGRSFDRDYDVVVIGSGSTVISGNKITGNTLGIGSSEFTQVVNAVIANNIIYGCGAGISLSAGEASTLTIEGNLITNNTGNGIAVSGNILKPIEGNLITNNGIGLRISPGAQVTIQKNTIVNNSIGISTGSDLATISNNNIQNVNDNLQLQQGTAKNIDVTNNWWGTTDTTLIGQSIFDNKNDFNLGIANFIPFLTAPNPEAPTMDYKPTTTTPITDTSPSPEQSSSNVTETSPEPPSIPNQNSTLPEPPLKSPDQPLDQQTDPWTSERQLYETVIAALIATVGALIVAICFALRKRR